MAFLTRDTQVSRVRIFVHHFEFSLKNADLAARHVQLLRNLRIKELLGNCLESKKLLEKKKVDRNTRSCQKVAEQLAESPSQCDS